MKSNTMSARFFNRFTLGVVLIGFGVLLVLIFGLRSWRSYQQLRYIRDQGINRGVASVDAIQPWMPIRYVAVAYGVPEEYIFAQLGIPFDRRNRNETLGQLNQLYQLGRSSAADRPLIVDEVAAAILAYRANPVATGLEDIRPWMTIRYIANSTGVPEAYLLEQLNLGAHPNDAVMPLDELAAATRYPGGPPGLVDATKAALKRYEEAP